MRWFPI